MRSIYYKNTFKGLIPHIVFQRIQQADILVLPKEYLIFALSVLKRHVSFRYSTLLCLSGVDLVNKRYRFCLVYELLSLTHNSRLRLKLFVEEFAAAPSIVGVFYNSNWWEREVWDLFGVYFLEHPDLRRLLTDYGFEGHPMRKDFPLSGYVELRYDFAKKRLLLESLELSQEFRFFSFEMPW